MHIHELTTKRLKLRCWQPSDLAPFAALNNDPDVMAYFPNRLSSIESKALAKKMQSRIEAQGWGWWAVELIQTQEFIGCVGLSVPGPDLPCSPCTEIGWRLANQFWGKGFATEAAQEALTFAFTKLACEEIVSFTTVKNEKSRAVMERLGLTNSGENFLHPQVAYDTGLQEHVLYRISLDQWQSGR